MRVVVLLLMLGCDDATSIEGDRDGDRIGDDVDPCLATAAEAAADLDGDGRAGDADPCPFDAADADRDGDGVPDACDPFPAVAGDTHRCTMPLRDAALAGTIWTPRTGAAAWQVRDGLRTDPAASASIVATVGFEHAPTTTFDVRVTFAAEPTTSERYFKVWLRAGALFGTSVQQRRVAEHQARADAAEGKTDAAEAHAEDAERRGQRLAGAVEVHLSPGRGQVTPGREHLSAEASDEPDPLLSLARRLFPN